MANKLRRLHQRWRRWRTLSGAERRVFCQASLLLPGCRFALWWVSFQRLQSLISRLRPCARQRGAIAATSVAAMVSSAAALSPLDYSCLHRSLALCWLLARRGVAGQLRIGVRQDENGFTAHAWVEIDGVPINDVPEVRARFTAFERDFAAAGGRKETG